jgi:tol-pal system protein YbgF
MRASWRLWVAPVLLGACATRSDLRRVEEQLTLSRAEAARQDSVRAVRLAEVITAQRKTMDSLAAAQRSLAAVQTSLQSFKGDVSTDLYAIQQQLVQVQALTGQSQQRLTELRTQLEARGEQIGATTAATGGDTAKAAAAATPSADQLFQTSLDQLRRGSPSTARQGFRELLRAYPNDSHVPDATYFIGESFATSQPDSAAVYYNQVVRNAPTSPRAATALYKLGLLAERQKNLDEARTSYQRVVKEYPKSDEAALAKDRLKALGR